MQNAGDRAAALNQEGYNCAQSVFGAFAEECGVDFETAILISSSFGGGIAQTRGICGAFTGMCMAMGAKHGYSDPADKAAFYVHLRAMEQEMLDRWETLNCGELLRKAECAGEEKPCRELVRHAAEITQVWMEKLDQ